MKHIILIIFAILLSVNSANAGQSTNSSQSNWVDMGLDAKIRLISSNKIDDNGFSLVGIEIKMPKNIKTYWRIPGETGIPLQLDFSSIAGVKSHKIFWPYPLRETKYGTQDYVYYGSIIFPIMLELDKNTKNIKADIFLGICANICIPANISLELELDFNKINRANSIRLEQALIDTPMLWEKQTLAFGDVQFNKTSGTLEIEINQDIISPDLVVLDNGDLSTLFSIVKLISPNKLSYQLQNMKQADELIKKPLRITFMTDQGAYELEKEIKLVD